MNALAIWWTDNGDARFIRNNDAYRSLPIYIRSAIIGRTGRNGRGRLWTTDPSVDGCSIPLELFDATPLGVMLGEHYGGIVIHREHVPLLADFPGIVTDFSLKRI